MKDAREKVRAYFASLPPASRGEMKKLREAVRSAAPHAIEHFGYGIPGFKLDGKILVYYAAWKRHVSVYPVTAAIKRAYARELTGYEMSKGTVRFPLDERVPVGLVKRLVKSRIAELRQKRKK
jgi:uncharacterized protein YdhG (YjbR/CyaY superfamily)